MKVITLVNQKGGVGKTTTAVSLSCGLAKKHKKVLVIDFDPQGSLSRSIGATLKTKQPTVFEWLSCDPNNTAAFDEVVQNCGNIDLLPANIRLSQAEMFISQKLNREKVLEKAIKRIPKSAKYNYDYILIDCPPSLGMLTINALSATDEVIIPHTPDWLCYEGASDLINTIITIKNEVNHKIAVKGILITFNQLARNISDIVDLIKELAAKVNSKVYTQMIRQNVAAADAASYGLCVYDYKPGCAAAQDYTKFVEEFLEDEKNGNQ